MNKQINTDEHSAKQHELYVVTVLMHCFKIDKHWDFLFSEAEALSFGRDSSRAAVQTQ